MIANAERWQGQLVDGKFLIGRVLGGSDRSAVFIVEKGVGATPAVIRLVEADSVDEQLARWRAAAKLHHPNLMQIFDGGRCQMDGRDLCYVVTEYAEENLAQIIPERRLTADEAQQVLRDLLAVLGYIHGQGFVHGRVKPSNIFAAGETIKLSSESLRPAGQRPAGRETESVYDAPEVAAGAVTPAADMWSLGVTLVQALTQRLPKRDEQNRLELVGVPMPLQGIVVNCLSSDPGQRWTVSQISDRISGTKPVSSPRASAAPTSASPLQAAAEKSSTKWAYIIPLIALALLGVLLLLRPKAHEVKAPAQSTEQNPVERTPTTGGAGATTSSLPTTDTQDCCDGHVATRVIPQVSPSALRTVQGKIRVQIDLNVDETGKVTDARFKSAGPSRYFAERSMEAARRWTFKPPVENGQAVASEWRVKFLIGRRAIDDSAEQIKP